MERAAAMRPAFRLYYCVADLVNKSFRAQQFLWGFFWGGCGSSNNCRKFAELLSNDRLELWKTEYMNS